MKFENCLHSLSSEGHRSVKLVDSVKSAKSVLSALRCDSSIATEIESASDDKGKYYNSIFQYLYSNLTNTNRLRNRILLLLTLKGSI